MRDKIFNHPATRHAVNEIVHPAVGKDYEKWHQEKKSPFTVKEAALLVESGSYKDLDHLIMIEAPLQVRIQRVIQRDQISSAQVRGRIDSQWPRSEEHTSELQSRGHLVCRLLLEKKKTDSIRA